MVIRRQMVHRSVKKRSFIHSPLTTSPLRTMDYQPGKFEAKWKKWWEENQVYKVSNSSDKPKVLCAGYVPLPLRIRDCMSAIPLGYIASDIYARHKRMKGFQCAASYGI